MHSFCPQLTDVADAMGIYTTYIALNALTPIGIPDDIRQKVESKLACVKKNRKYIIIYNLYKYLINVCIYTSLTNIRV